ncbi:MAG: hypothetical protein ABGX16_01380, partial [Pirellulales bacterium]
MGFDVAEKWNGRIRNNADLERQYIVRHDGSGNSDESTAAIALFDWLAIPANIPGIDLAEFPQTDIGVREIIGSSPVTFMGRGVWATKIKTPAGTVQPPTPVDVNETTFTFNAQAEGGKIQSSLATPFKQSLLKNIGLEPLFGDPSGFNGLINVEGEGKDMKVKGLDLSPPPSTFDINWVIPNATLTPAVIQDLMAWVGTVNSAAFTLFGHAFSVGELFYNSVQGTKRTKEDWEVAFSFAFSRDRMTEEVPIMSGLGSVP